MLYVNSLRVPAVAERVRKEFADILETDAGRLAEQIALAEMLQAVGRGWYEELAPHLRQRAEELTGVTPPTPPPERDPDMTVPPPRATVATKGSEETVRLSSRRLVMRGPEAGDIDWVTTELQDLEIQRNTTVPSPYARADAERFVRNANTGQRTKFIITESGQRAGAISLHMHDKRAPSIGYWIGKAARGRGIATEAVTRVCRWGFEDLGLPIITWSAKVGNEASRAVAAKAGFQMEGTLRLRSMSQGALRDCWVGSLLPHELRDIP